MSRERPSPDVLLQRAQEEERLALRGKLKIYLGAAPGVGKTHTMLEDALAKRTQGLDIIIGVVESHGRKEIEAFLKKFEILPRQKINYHGQDLYEFDLDNALKRNPAVILMDEMAHTNVPGLRHAKRWQDIKELLDRGINVYTTLNVQHIESLNDIVTQIIHIQIKETVPDSMLDMADSIELVDLPPEDLLKRLQEGKVYFPKQAELAVEHFFRQGNLNALREIALRVTAERVGEKMLLYREGKGIKFIWPTKEKIMVCVSSTTNATKLIRAARRMANGLQAEWLAVHINTGDSEIERNGAIQNLRLAEQLGAETKVLPGIDVTKEIIHFAREKNITKIIVGKKNHSFLRNLIYPSVASQLVRHSDEIDIYMTSEEPARKKTLKLPSSKKNPFPWVAYAISIFAVGLTTGINFLLSDYLHSTNIIMVYLVGVTFVALLGRTGPSILASILSVLAYAYFFIPPYYQIIITDLHSIFTLFVMLLVTQIISHLTILARRQVAASHTTERRTATLHSLTRQLAGTRGVDKLLDIAVAYTATIFNSEVLALLAENGRLMVKAGHGSKLMLNEKEQSVAQWVYDLGQVAGLGTDTLPFSEAIYVPLLSSNKPLGVLRVRPKQPENLFTPEQMHLLEGCANQIALAIEVDGLHEKAKQSELESEANRIYSALLDSVSHDLSLPLVSAMRAAKVLADEGSTLDGRKVKKMGHEIYLELDQLHHLINNILQMSYLETKTIQLKKENHSLFILIHDVLKKQKPLLLDRIVEINIADDFPSIPFDKALIQAVFTHLFDNTAKFTPVGSPIEINATIEHSHVLIHFCDKGPGIALDELHKLFDKFYRGRLLTIERGLGLGLAICHHIVKAHGGEIWAENRKEGGAVFCFTLPLKH